MNARRRLNVALIATYVFCAIVIALDMFLWRPL